MSTLKSKLFGGDRSFAKRCCTACIGNSILRDGIGGFGFVFDGEIAGNYAESEEQNYEFADG